MTGSEKISESFIASKFSYNFKGFNLIYKIDAISLGLSISSISIQWLESYLYSEGSNCNYLL